ncbi:MAG: KH domain-containing protein [Actinobacteria bacterium]|nr:KH domain-containing protein [Actinomycetota bacterium]
MSAEAVLRYVAEQLVDNPAEVDVTPIEGERSLILELRVHPDDLGKVIGKRGRTAKALRTLVKAAAEEDRNVQVEIVD